jgi:hypothetical protein
MVTLNLGGSMKKTKPTYTAPEIRNLLESMEYSVIDDALQSFLNNNPDEKTRELMAKYGDNVEYPEKVFEAYEEIAADARNLECQARALRSIVKIFKCPVEDLPTKINDENKTLATIATWRLSLGR